MVDSKQNRLCYLYSMSHAMLPILYLGITYYPDIRRRDHLRESSNKLLKEYISLYGKENFIFKVLTSGSREEMEELEELSILEAKTLNRLVVCNILVGSVAIGASSQIGESHWNARFTKEDVLSIRSRYALGGITQKQLGNEYNCSNKVISKITTGSRWLEASGKITKNSCSNKVANRRKITDDQVFQIRNEALEEYNFTGSLSIPDIADMYSISRNSMRAILTGVSYKNIKGPILKKDYYLDFGKNNVQQSK